MRPEYLVAAEDRTEEGKKGQERERQRKREYGEKVQAERARECRVAGVALEIY